VTVDTYLNELPSVAERLLSRATVDSPTASVVAQRRAAGATLAAWQSAWDKLEGQNKQKQVARTEIRLSQRFPVNFTACINNILNNHNSLGQI
jgi:hypothetical protein